MTAVTTSLFGRARLAENIMHFARVLRAAGLPVGPAKVIAALDAVDAVGIENREDFRAALQSVLIERHEQQTLFDQAFELFWRNPRMLERMLQLLLPRIYGRVPRDEAAAPLPGRLADAMSPPDRKPTEEAAEQEVELDAALTFSPREVLQGRDFESMSVDELAQVKSMIARLRLPLPEIPTRRTVVADRGTTVDLRASLRAMASARGAVVPLAWRKRRRRRNLIAAGLSQPAGAKPLTTVAVEVVLVVVARVVEVEVTVGIGVVEDCVEGVVLVGSGWLRD